MRTYEAVQHGSSATSNSSIRASHSHRMSATPCPDLPPPQNTIVISQSGAAAGSKSLWVTKPLPDRGMYGCVSRLCTGQYKTIVFCRSRNVVEKLYSVLTKTLPNKMTLTYRGGYSTEARRDLEVRASESRSDESRVKTFSHADLLRSLQSRFDSADIVVCTNAVQEGIDFSGFTLCVMISSSWTKQEVDQCIGRVGRRGMDGVGVIVEWGEERMYGYPVIRGGR